MNESLAGPGETGSGTMPATKPRPASARRIQPLNVAPGSDLIEGAGFPLAACDCDNHQTCTVHCAIGDVKVDVDACGIWG